MQGLSLGRQKNSLTWNPAAAILLGCIRAYRTIISPLLRPRCRFTPTCSEYALRAIEKHGAGRGGWLSAKRVLRCNRLFAGGWDPVP